jgi:putative phage-type endonuclease
MIYSEEEYPQGSDAWQGARAAKTTASKVTDVLAKLKSGMPAASRATYMGQLIAERLTGVKADSFSSGSMQWGTETEPQAIAAYEFLNDTEVKRIAFIDHPTIEFSGASPDGLLGDDGLIEIKCPNTSTHISYLINRKIPKNYINQIQWQLACTGRKWCDFMSFDPRMPEHLNKLIIRVDRDDKYIQEMEIEVIKFNTEINEKLKILEAL